MPYITQDLRDKINLEIFDLQEQILNISGSDNIEGLLNYVITNLLVDKAIWCDASSALSYRHYNRMLGVLESVKQEIYRRIIAPYEDKCIMKNGDIDAFGS